MKKLITGAALFFLVACGGSIPNESIATVKIIDVAVKNDSTCSIGFVYVTQSGYHSNPSYINRRAASKSYCTEASKNIGQIYTVVSDYYEIKSMRREER